MAMERKKLLSLSAGIGMLVLAIAIIAYSNWPEKKYSQNMAYFSDDDGKTWYQDSIDLMPPYQHNGHEAFGAVVYTYSGGSKQFCGFLFRFPTAVKKQIESSASVTNPAHNIAYNSDIGNSREVKAPLSPGPWVTMGSLAAQPIMQVKAPDGSELDQLIP